jgi:hypothetical protein
LHDIVIVAEPPPRIRVERDPRTKETSAMPKP